MPVRATKRGTERTTLARDCDVLICGASFAGLAVARELQGSGAKVMMIDRYEVGERATSACGIPTSWLTALDLQSSLRQTFGELVIHTPWEHFRLNLPWTFSTFDYRELCASLRTQSPDVEFETATASGITRHVGRVADDGSGHPLAGAALHAIHTDRGDIRAPLVVDALGWRRLLGRTPFGEGLRSRGHGSWIPRKRVTLSRGLEVHPHGTGEDMQIWVDPRYVRAGYGWSFPADGEMRVGVGSFIASHTVRKTTDLLAADESLDAVRYQGNYIPHRLRSAVEDGIFFAGDSAGHCLPLTAEGIRTALYFGLACGRELRGVLEGEMHREVALSRYHDFNEQHRWAFSWLLGAQRFVGVTGRMPLLGNVIGGIDRAHLVHRLFDGYLEIAPPRYARSSGLAFGVKARSTELVPA